MTGSASTLKSLQSPRAGKSLNLSHASIAPGLSASKPSGANSVFSSALKLAKKPSKLGSPRASKPVLMIHDHQRALEPSLD